MGKGCFKNARASAHSRISAYRLPAQAALPEQDEVDRPAVALNRVHAKCCTAVFLMKGYGDGDDEQNFHIHLLGMHLERALAALRRACSIPADYVSLCEKRVAAPENGHEHSSH